MFVTKIMKTLLALAGVLLVAGGCSRQNILSDEQSGLVLSGRVVNGTSAVWATKADDNQQLQALPEGDLGVYVLTVSGSAQEQTNFETTQWKNMQFTSNASGDISGADNVTLRMGTVYNIYAYAPRIAGLSDAHNIPVQHGADMLWAKTPQVTATAKETKAKLQFYHSGAQIGFRLKMKNGENVDLSGAKLEVSGFYKTGTLDLESGKMILQEEDRTETITDFSGQKTNILITGNNMSFSVKVTDVPGQEGKVFTGNLPSACQAGKSYLYDVNIDTDDARQAITFTATIEDWEDVNGGTLPIG